MLVGKQALKLFHPVRALTTAPPPIPVGIPSQLLERRPRHRSAERSMAAANAQIGVAYAAYYPALTLSASGGMQSSALKNLLDWPSRFWSVGPSISETVYDGGLRRAEVNQYGRRLQRKSRAYRQSVLTAFQQVEDSLAAVRHPVATDSASAGSRQLSQTFLSWRRVADNNGIDPYIDVVTAQTTVAQ